MHVSALTWLVTVSYACGVCVDAVDIKVDVDQHVDLLNVIQVINMQACHCKLSASPELSCIIMSLP